MRGLTIYTAGHSSRSLEEFLALLEGHRIRTVADVRRRPWSSRFHWFGREALEDALRRRGLRYVWLEALGGLRGGGLAAYRRHMETREFEAGLDALLGLASRGRTLVMCAERDWRRCHRALLADRLTALGVEVIHLGGPGPPERHPGGMFGGGEGPPGA